MVLMSCPLGADQNAIAIEAIIQVGRHDHRLWQENGFGEGNHTG